MIDLMATGIIGTILEQNRSAFPKEILEVDLLWFGPDFHKSENWK